MKRFITWMLAILALALTTSTMLIVPAHADDSITVESVSYSQDKAKATATDAVNVEIDGATQLLWWYPDHNVKVTKKSLRKAPNIKVKYTACANQSKSIAKQAKGANLVVAKVGSTICNTGMNGNIIGGFKWKVTKGPAVLKWNSSLKLYEHVYNIIGGKLVKTCRNRMGGHVDEMYEKVIQVRYEGDLVQESDVTVDAEANATVQVSKDCAGGKVFASASASASSSASAKARAKFKFMASTISSVTSELTAKVKTAVQAKAASMALAKVTIDCSDAPPANNPPAASANAKACVDANKNDGIITVVVNNPNNTSAPLTVNLQSQTQTTTITANGTATLQFNGFAPGNYNGTAVLGGSINKSVSFTVTVQKCDVPVTPPPNLLEIDTINDVLVNNTRTITITGTVAQGRSATLFVSAKNGGTITSGKNQTVTGNFTAQVTYMAPSEVPVANGDIAAGRDRVDAVLTQDDGQSDTISTNQFEIRPRPTTPA